MFRALAIRSRRPQFSTRIHTPNNKWFNSSFLLRRKDMPVALPATLLVSQTANIEPQSAAVKKTTEVLASSTSTLLEAPLEDVKIKKPRKKKVSRDHDITSSKAASTGSFTATEDGIDGKSKARKVRKPKVKEVFFGPENQRGPKRKPKEERPAQQVLNPAILVPQTREKHIRDLLKDVTEKSKKSKWSAMARKRVDIISEKLCDDILQRHGPSLEKHRGCDIIDINPGVGVWSMKLHDYLQPRTHILMEPCYKDYQPALDPLLETPGSKYQLVPKSGIVWNHLERILCKEYLPFQEALEPSDPRLDLPNDTLLVTANIASYPRQPYRRFPSIANLIIHQFLAATRTHSLFHRYGKIRMLLWFEDEDLKLIIPRILAGRKRSAIEGEMSCKSIEIVVSSGVSNTERFQREKHLEFEGLRRVRQNMLEKGILTPEGRESNLVKDFDQHESGAKDSSAFEPRFLEELEELKRRYGAGEFEKWVTKVQTDSHGRKQKDKGNPVPYTVEYERMRYLQVRFNREGKRKVYLTELVDEFDSIMELQRSHFTSNSQEGKDRLLLEFRERAEKWKAVVASIPSDEQDTMIYLCDQRHAFQQNPPVLFWDRREAEPLKSNPEFLTAKIRQEFSPNPADLALVDFQPCALPSAVTVNLTENYDVLDYIIQRFAANPTNSIEETLRSLWPGGYEWLLADCPVLSDPTKGGSYDLDLIRVRTASASMIAKVVESWLRWPYRPSRIQLMKSMGADAWDVDEDID